MYRGILISKAPLADLLQFVDLTVIEILERFIFRRAYDLQLMELRLALGEHM